MIPADANDPGADLRSAAPRAPLAPALRRFAPLLALVAGTLLLALLRAVPPGPGSPYPRCTFFRLSGLYCPGCGTARCLAALARGEVRQAIAWNALTATLAPIGVGLALAGTWRAVRRRAGAAADAPDATRPRRLLPRWAGPAIAAAVVGFGILRNLPFRPFALLAPHALGG